MGTFYGRSLCVIDDFSQEERLYLLEHARFSNPALETQDEAVLNRYRIDDPDFGIYEVFLEDSTRTKESFLATLRSSITQRFRISTAVPPSTKGKLRGHVLYPQRLLQYDFHRPEQSRGVCTYLEESSPPTPTKRLEAKTGVHQRR